MSRFTPGPLVASNNNALKTWGIYRQTRNGIDQFALGDANEKADALLWAASPDFYVAAGEMVAAIQAWRETGKPDLTRIEKAQDALRAVIAKAEGREA